MIPEQTLSTQKQVDHLNLQRLVFAKYLLHIAEQSVILPSPKKYVTLLNLQDAVEVFLYSACDHLGVEIPPNNQFNSYLSQINKKLEPKSLIKHNDIQRLNKARVGLKHHTNFPSDKNLEEFVMLSREFLMSNTKIVFEMDFLSISLVDIVGPTVVRDHLRLAEIELKAGDKKKSLMNISKAWQLLLRFHTSIDHSLSGERVYEYVDPLTSLGNIMFSFSDSEIIAFADQTTDALARIADTLRLLALGIDCRNYHVFAFGLPYIAQNNDLSWEAYYRGNEESMDEAVILWKIDFVVDTSLRLSSNRPMQ